MICHVHLELMLGKKGDAGDTGPPGPQGAQGKCIKIAQIILYS